jgi:hypothetical protein
MGAESSGKICAKLRLNAAMVKGLCEKEYANEYRMLIQKIVIVRREKYL